MTSKTHRFTTCHRHPSTPVTGFCASCLRERLAGIDSSSPASPELRRTKSFSARTAGASAVPEPRRRSCEVRLPPPRGPLSDLFNVDDKRKKPPNRNAEICSGTAGVGIGENESGGAVRVSGDDGEEGRTMKEFIDLELRSKKNTGRDIRDIAASFRDAASVFSKRLMKWRRKQNPKRNRNNEGAGVGPVEKSGSRTLRETQSEVGEYGFALGRRSCDTDPRFSVDDSRFSFEAHRASWDGYLIGKAYPRVSPMVRLGDRVLVEEEEEEEEGEVSLENCEECCPGGSAQTKHYYSDWHRRRRSFDRSNSRRKSLMGDVDELRVMSNAKVSPATTELFYGAKVLITENDLRDANLKPMNSVQSDSVMGSASKDDEACDAAIGDDQKGLNMFHKWVRLWSKLGLVQRKREDKLGEGEYAAAGDVVNKPVAESWQKLRRVVNGQASESVSQKLIRSYSVSCRDPCRTAGLVNGFVGSETKGHVLNGRQKFMLQRNRSARYSPSNVDNGLLRFYLTPLKSYSRRSRSGKSSLKSSYPTARSFF